MAKRLPALSISCCGLAQAMNLAFAARQDSARLRDFNFICTAIDPSFDVLRTDARDPELLRRQVMGRLAVGRPAP